MMRTFVIAAVALSLVPVMGGCPKSLGIDIPLLTPKTSDESQILELMNNVHRDMQARRTNRLMTYLSEDYLDSQGRDYAAMREYLVAFFGRYRSIEITRVPPKLKIDGDTAVATETFGTQARPFDPNENPVINLHGQMDVYLHREDGVWRIVEWGQVR